MPSPWAYSYSRSSTTNVSVGPNSASRHLQSSGSSRPAGAAVVVVVEEVEVVGVDGAVVGAVACVAAVVGVEDAVPSDVGGSATRVFADSPDDDPPHALARTTNATPTAAHGLLLKPTARPPDATDMFESVSSADR